MAYRASCYFQLCIRAHTSCSLSVGHPVPPVQPLRLHPGDGVQPGAQPDLGRPPGPGRHSPAWLRPPHLPCPLCHRWLCGGVLCTAKIDALLVSTFFLQRDLLCCPLDEQHFLLGGHGRGGFFSFLPPPPPPPPLLNEIVWGEGGGGAWVRSDIKFSDFPTYVCIRIQHYPPHCHQLSMIHKVSVTSLKRIQR